MACGEIFARTPGQTFGLKVTENANVLACTGLIVRSGSNPGEERLTSNEMAAGFSWQVQADTTYTFFLNVVSKVPGQNVSADIEIPLGSQPQTCTRMSSGVLGIWDVVAV
jgi:hypothetical protein